MADETSVGAEAQLSSGVYLGPTSSAPVPVKFARGVIYGILGGVFLWMMVVALALWL